MPAELRRRLREQGPLAGVLAAAIAVRIAFLSEASRGLLLRVPLLDGRDYLAWSQRLVAGDWGWGEPYWYGPLYPHLLALARIVGGPGALIMPALQLVLGVVAVALVYVLAHRLTDRNTALTAAALYAGYGPPVLYAGLLLVATVLTVLALVVALLLVHALERPTPRRWLALGAACGLAALARGNLLYVVPGALLLLWWESRARAEELVRPARRGPLALALLAGTVLVIAPVTLRNVFVGRDLVLISSNVGVNLRIGQQSRHQGRFGPVLELTTLQDDLNQEQALERQLGRSLRPSEVSRLNAAAALREAVARPGVTAWLYARKAYRFWNGYELPQITSWRVWRTRLASLRWLPVPYTLLAAGGLVGLGVLRGRPRRVLAVLIVGYFLSLWPFFPTARYRLPLAPWLAVPAAALLVESVRASRRGVWRRVGIMLGALGVGLVALWPAWTAVPYAEEAWQVALHDASRAATVGDTAALGEAVRRAEAWLPGRAETPYRLAGFLERLDDWPAALGALEEAQRRLPDQPLVLQRMGLNLEHQGQLSAAAAAFAAAARADTTWAEPWLAEGRVWRQLGEVTRAVVALREALRRTPGSAQARGNLALLLAEIGQTDEARALLTKLTRDFPDHLPGWFNLALLEHRAGRIAAARAALAGARAAAGHRATAAQQEQLVQLERLLGT